MYRTLLSKWRNKANADDDPTNDCLAIAREVYCAYSIPNCKDQDNVIIPSSLIVLQVAMPLCKWICDLWSDRCPNVNSNPFISSRKSKVSVLIGPKMDLALPVISHSLMASLSSSLD